MHIKQVVIRGFKTYKEQTALTEELSTGTNAVVGFNGSGKSNFYQAILFVLSDHLSTLRAETRKALLHEGAGQQVLTAFVEVILDNADRRIPVESDQVSIRRHIGMKKDDWLLDGKHTTKAEIFGLLEGAGFSKSNPYYIVQQGKVSELTLMTDTQRLSLLKEISGAGVYDDRRAESVKLMEDTLVRRERTQSLIDEIQEKLGSLESEQHELRECERLEIRRRTLEYVLADRDWKAVQDRISELEEKRSECSNKLLAVQGQLGEVRVCKEEATTRQCKSEEERSQANELLKVAHATRDEKYEVLAKARLEANDASSQQRKSEDLNAERLQELQKAREQLGLALAEVEAAQPKVEASAQRVHAAEAACQVAQTKKEQLLAKQSRKSQYKTVTERNDALKQEIHRRTAQLKEGRRKMGECDERLLQLREKATKATAEAVEQRQMLTAKEQRLSSLSADIRHAGEELDRMSEKVRLLHQERGRISEASEKLQKELQANQHRLEGTMPRAFRQGVRAVMAWVQEKGMRDRVPGTLISLIEVPATFRAAVESFAGMALFNILVTDDEIAGEVVKMVRTTRSGQIVVTPLNQLRTRHFDIPKLEGVKPLTEVIRCPEWVLPAVQQVFGSAVVCRTMELCEEAAQTYGLDAITLDGDRVSRKGVVTGGYQDPHRFARLSFAEAMRETSGNLRAADADLPRVQERIQEALVALDDLHTNRRTLQEERESIRADVLHLAESMQALETSATKAGRDSRELEDWRNRMEIAIGQHEASIEAKKTEMQSKSLSGLAAEEEKILTKLATDLEALEATLRSEKEELRTLRLAVDEKEARVQSFLRPRVNTLELQASGALQDGFFHHADEALQTCSRMEREHQDAAAAADELARKIQALADMIEQARTSAESAAAEEQRLQEETSELTVRVDTVATDLAAQVQKRTEIDTRLHGLTAPATEVEAYRQVPKPQLVRDLAATNKELQAFEHVNRKAVEQFENFSEQLQDLKRRKADIDAGEAAIESALKTIDGQKEVTMMQALNQVNTHFQRVFAELVPGGMARLRVLRQNDQATAAAGDDEETPLEGRGEVVGVRIGVSFTGQAQSYVNMNQLSGGQKTVVALSLIFAIQRLDPAPFYLLDEVDAALDASYRTALANLIGKTAQSSQVILTTFRPEAIDKADKCYRVYQQNRASRIDVVTKDQAKQVLKEQDRLSQVAAS